MRSRPQRYHTRISNTCIRNRNLRSIRGSQSRLFPAVDSTHTPRTKIPIMTTLDPLRDTKHMAEEARKPRTPVLRCRLEGRLLRPLTI